MAARSFILLPEATRWRVAVVNASDRANWTDLASDAPPEMIAQTLKRAGYAGAGVILAIPSAWCMAASISTTDLPPRDRKARLFRLEEKLPIPAEEIVADFIDAGGTALAVCVRIDQLQPVIESLESEGIAIESIVPAALLAAQAMPRTTDPRVFLLGAGDSVDVITFAAGGPIAWSVSPPAEADLQLHVQIAQRNSVASADAGGPQDPQELIVAAGKEVLAGRMRPLIDLRRDALAARDRWRGYRRGIDAALVTAAVLLLAIAGASFVRAQRYNSAARQHEGRLTDLFRAEFPGWAVPANIRAVIDSEHRRLAAQQLGAARQATATSALHTLVNVLSAVPEAAQLRLERMTFDDHGFSMDGHIAAPGDLDAAMGAIRSAGLTVAPPQVTRDGENGSWRFNLRGELSQVDGPVAEVK